VGAHDADGDDHCKCSSAADLDVACSQDWCGRDREAAVIEFKNILCPIDFSDTSTRALSYAAAIARWYESRLEVLHVAPAFHSGLTPATSARFDGDSPFPVSHDDIVAEIRRAVDAAHGGGLNVRALAQDGRAHELIVCRAQAQPADLLVMGTHGRSGVNRLLLGSVTEKVLRTAPCPVLTVPPAASEMAGAPVASN
jgi:nucleotide-binding universal stress UspA family protein